MKQLGEVKKRMMVFGVFDRLHEGHISFLEQAAGMGEELIVVVARDASVKELKRKMPTHNETERLQAVKNNSSVHRAVLGDSRLGSYDVIKKYKPDLVCLGYDQTSLEEDLKRRMAGKKIPTVELVSLRPHKPEEFHTSFLDFS